LQLTATIMAVSAYEIQHFKVWRAFVPKEKAGYMKAQAQKQLSDGHRI
jgi:hypothetical protein